MIPNSPGINVLFGAPHCGWLKVSKNSAQNWVVKRSLIRVSLFYADIPVVDSWHLNLIRARIAFNVPRQRCAGLVCGATRKGKRIDIESIVNAAVRRVCWADLIGHVGTERADIHPVSRKGYICVVA